MPRRDRTGGRGGFEQPVTWVTLWTGYMGDRFVSVPGGPAGPPGNGWTGGPSEVDAGEAGDPATSVSAMRHAKNGLRRPGARRGGARFVRGRRPLPEDAAGSRHQPPETKPTKPTAKTARCCCATMQNSMGFDRRRARRHEQQVLVRENSIPRRAEPAEVGLRPAASRNGRRRPRRCRAPASAAGHTVRPDDEPDVEPHDRAQPHADADRRARRRCSREAQGAMASPIYEIIRSVQTLPYGPSGPGSGR